jgi:uncharacterized membrane protein YfcA
MDPILLAAVGVAAGAALQSATGFGFALVAAPLVFASGEPAEAVGLMVLLSVVVNALILLGEQRRPRPLGRECAVLTAAAAPGTVAGIVILRALDAVTLQVAVSVGVVATLLARRAAQGRHAPAWAGPLAGFASGALNTSTTTSGPPLLLYLTGRGIEPGRLRDTVIAVFLGLSALSGAALWATATSQAVPAARDVLLLVPLAVAGQLVGRPLFRRLAHGGGYERILTAMLVVSVAVGLATAIW